MIILAYIIPMYLFCMALFAGVMQFSFAPKQEKRKEPEFDIPEVSKLTVFKAVSAALKTDREYQKKINRLRKRGYRW